MAISEARTHLRQALEAHLTNLGYTSALSRADPPVPEIVRINPLRGRLVYAETVLRSDMRRKRCHERLRFFSQRRTRRRSSILFFIGVPAGDEEALETLLTELDIRGYGRGGHVQIVPVDVRAARQRQRAQRQSAPRPARKSA